MHISVHLVNLQAVTIAIQEFELDTIECLNTGQRIRCALYLKFID